MDFAKQVFDAARKCIAGITRDENQIIDESIRNLITKELKKRKFDTYEINDIISVFASNPDLTVALVQSLNKTETLQDNYFKLDSRVAKIKTMSDMKALQHMIDTIVSVAAHRI